MHVVNTSTGLSQTSTINVDLAGVNPKTTLNDIVSQLNGVANVTASVTSDGRLQINTANGYEIEFSNDNSGALADLGVNTFFTGTSSQDVGVNSALGGRPDAARRGAGRWTGRRSKCRRSSPICRI